ncbi:MAG: S46 family peptidase, partial [Bacteroidia bacterium]
IMFDPDQVRNIVLDVRYTLFVIDKYAGAGYLLNEMTLKK